MPNVCTEIAADNAHRFWVAITVPDAATGVSEPSTGLSVTAFLATTADGADCAGTTTSLSEFSGLPGNYSAVLTASLVNAAIAAGAQWEVYTADGFCESRRLTVRSARIG